MVAVPTGVVLRAVFVSVAESRGRHCTTGALPPRAVVSFPAPPANAGHAPAYSLRRPHQGDP